LAQTGPDYGFLEKRCGIHNLDELKATLLTNLETVNLSQKSKDFEHLLFEKSNSRRILAFGDFVSGLTGVRT
jgi:hypothetical protein